MSEADAYLALGERKVLERTNCEQRAKRILHQQLLGATGLSKGLTRQLRGKAMKQTVDMIAVGWRIPDILVISGEPVQ